MPSKGKQEFLSRAAQIFESVGQLEMKNDFFKKGYTNWDGSG